MKQSTKHEVKGRFHEVKGAVKQSVGRALNSPRLQAEGGGEKIAGKVQKKIGQAERVLEK